MKSRFFFFFFWWHVCLSFEDKYFRRVPSGAQSVARWVYMGKWAEKQTIAHSSLHEARLKSPFREATRLSLWAQHHLHLASFEHQIYSVESYLILHASGCCLASFPKEEIRVQVLTQSCPHESLLSRVFWCDVADFLGTLAISKVTYSIYSIPLEVSNNNW